MVRWLITPLHLLADDTMEIYYINLKSSIVRDNMTIKHLSHFNNSFFRVDAVSYASNRNFNLSAAHHPCELPTEPLIFNSSFSTFSSIRINELCISKLNTIKEIAVTLSHVKAIYSAITSNNSYPYAMIMEDDMELQFDVDFDAMIKRFPPKFGIIQVFVSNIRFCKRVILCVSSFLIHLC